MPAASPPALSAWRAITGPELGSMPTKAADPSSQEGGEGHGARW